MTPPTGYAVPKGYYFPVMDFLAGLNYECRVLAWCLERGIDYPTFRSGA